ncbi:unnamed protein product [Ilex paraguariensis]|uniref:Subtilisin-like protease SBT2.4 n=1 Tax=Ilex paraguariensis TaxID=185542 RepID=A0ABC8UMB7_9AQUA
MREAIHMLASWQYRALLLLVIVTACIAEERDIYLVLVEGEPVAFHHSSVSTEEGRKPDPSSEVSKAHAKHLVDSHDKLLESTLDKGSYNKLYSFKHIVNGFAVHTTPSQAEKMKNATGVKLVERDRRAKIMTSYTPEFLGLPEGAWTEEGGERNAGEGIVIGFVDTGINPVHPSFCYDPTNPFQSNLSHFSGACEDGPRFPWSSCNGKIVSARFFSAGAQAVATLNASVDFLSPFDAVGHGSHVASTAAGNYGVPVVVDGFCYGRASGMAPRARIAVYKAIYPSLGTLADVVAAIDQFSHNVVYNFITMTRKNLLFLSHVASTAAGNYGVPVVVDGFCYGRASGMAPRARIAVYKAIYPSLGTLADVVAAIDQAVLDGVDILSLSIGPDEPPEDTITFLGTFDIFMLGAQKAGVFVVQAAGNQGPDYSSVVSYSPWAIGVAACRTDRRYPGTLILGNGQTIDGVGLSGIKPSGEVCATYFTKYESISRYYEQQTDRDQRGFVIRFNARASIGEGRIASYTGRAPIVSRFSSRGPDFIDRSRNPTDVLKPDILAPGQQIWAAWSPMSSISRYYEQQTDRDQRGFVIRFNARASIGEGRIASYTGRAPIVSRFSSRGPDFIDRSRNPTDVLKPDILAPGQQIWAAWSPMSVLNPILSGNSFALISGTSMATPHIAGIAALIKQYNPSWIPSTIFSAMSTTASKYNNLGELIMAEGPDIHSLYPSTPFDFGAGLVNPTRALDPGLVFSSEYEDYISFLCSLPNVDPATIKTATGELCSRSFGNPSDLNIPSVTISELRGTRTVRRSVKNIACKPETYLCAVIPPKGVVVEIHPSWFTIAPQKTQVLEIRLNVTQALDDFSFVTVLLEFREE